MLKHVMASLLIAATVSGSVAIAAPHRGDRGRTRGRAQITGVLRHLDLTAEQRETVRGIMEKHRAAVQPLGEQLRATMREYRELKQANDPRAEEVKTELQTLRESMKEHRQVVLQEISTVLTPEQRQKLEEWKSRRGPRG